MRPWRVRPERQERRLIQSPIWPNWRIWPIWPIWPAWPAWPTWPTWLACLAAAALTSAPAAALACGESLPAASRLQAAPDGPAAQGWQLALAPQPAPLTVGWHFALAIVLCAPPGQALPASLAVDAWMPAHRHGMNYRASVRALGDGRYLAEGLMLHMPGQWQLRFEWSAAVAGQAPLRLSSDITLR